MLLQTAAAPGPWPELGCYSVGTGEPLDEVARVWGVLGPALVVVTHGGDGALTVAQPGVHASRRVDLDAHADTVA